MSDYDDYVPPEWEHAAHEAQLRRQQNLARGWTPNRWQDPQQARAWLDENQDPIEMRALAHMREAQRQLEKRHEMEADFPRVTEFRPEWR